MSTVVAEKSSSLGVADGVGSGLAASGDVAVSDSPAARVRNSSRLYYLDWIRVLSLLFVLLMHVVEGGGFVVRFLPDDGLVPAIISLMIPVIGITLFFIVSGAASMFSLERRTSGQFLRERVLRLGLPFVIGGAVLVPPVTYVGRMLGSNAYPDFQGSLWDFYGVWFAHNFG